MNFERMDFSIVRGRSDGEAVFVADELRDVGIDFPEFFRICREVRAAAGGAGEDFQVLFGLSEFRGSGLRFFRDVFFFF